MKATFKLLLWTLGFLAILDVAIERLTRYPPVSIDPSINALQRYFNYGLSTERKVRWLAGASNEQAAGLALTGWLHEVDRQREPTESGRPLVAFYGMSFSVRVGEALVELEDGIDVRLKGGPAGSVNRSYAEYMIDRDYHRASVVVLGVLASSLAATNTTTHMTWNFEAPGSHFYPRFYLDGDGLRRVDPPARSLREFREVLDNPSDWSALLAHLRTHDDFFDELSFESDFLDASTAGRLLRRSWAQRHYRTMIGRFFDGRNFTDYHDNVEITLRLIERFAEEVSGRGAMPLILLIHDAGYGDALYQAVHPRLDALDIRYVSTHTIVPPDVFANFEPDGHFKPRYDEAIAAEVLELIRPALPAGPQSEP